jgi:hypothetical protein
MKTILTFLIFTLTLVGWAEKANSSEVLTLAVFDFESKDEAVKSLGPKVAMLLNANLSAEPQLITVERTELEKVLGEQELGLSGTVSADTAAKVGHLTGAKVLVTGRVFQVEKETVIVAKIIGTETSRVYGELVRGPVSELTSLATELSRKIAATVSTKGETLIAKVTSRDDWMKALKKSLPSGKLPSVSVKIVERHFGQAVIDPAAETEMNVILKECGFPLVDEKTPGKAEIEITGEAFSAFGIRKGNLISCRSRIEIKALNRAGEVLAVDRETSVAMDIAEQTAAKSALENATDGVARRVIPRLSK